MQVTTHLWTTDGGQTPPQGGQPRDILKLSGGHSRTSSTASQGATIDIFRIGGGAPRSLASPPRGPATRHLHVKWWALLDLWHHHPGGPPCGVFTLSGGRSQTPISPPSGPATRCLYAKWWVFLNLRHCPLGGPLCDVLQLSGKHSQTSSNYSQGGTTVHTTSRTFSMKFFLGPCVAKDLERSTTMSNKDG
jgi:hypothetical protein